MSYASILNSIVGDPAANSYNSSAEITSFLTTQRLFCPEWLAANPPSPTTDAAAIWACAFMDKAVDFSGYKATVTQYLRWPRSACYDPDGFYVLKDSIPHQIKEIHAQLSWEFLKQYRLIEPISLGIGITGPVKVGPITVNLAPNNYLPFIPKYLQLELSAWGILNGLGMGYGSLQQVKLLRS